MSIDIESTSDSLGSVVLPERVGVYRIIHLLGQGGMGVVYLAVRDDDQYEKQVAVKLINSPSAGREVVRRFRDERQILARLDHPNIARLLDGGATESGLPYMVMEYVKDGERIDDYCNRRSLPVRQRLQLFLCVCGAVEAAHRKLVVHRDIKPGNILVSEDGTPKLLDFGIAKLLDSSVAGDDSVTLTLHRIWTPGYASPEQVLGQPITTASDVYSLGVVLYELLTGTKVFLPSRCSAPEVSPTAPAGIAPRMIARVENPKLRHELSGDLDNIVAKAMAKEPDRRYGTVAQFADDIRCHLDGLPVSARPDTLTYRVGKFVRRHKASVAAAAVIALALLGGAAATAWQAHVARTERAKAERRFDDLHKLASSFLFEFDDAIKNVQGTTVARQLIVRRALDYLNKLAGEAGNDASLQRDLASAYERVSEIQGNFRGASLGDDKAALESSRKALALREALFRANPHDGALRRELAATYSRISSLLWRRSDPQAAFDMARKGLELMKSLHRRSVADDLQLGKSYIEYGWILAATKADFSGLDEGGRYAVEILEPLAGNDTEARFELARAYNYRAGAITGDPERIRESLALYRKAQEIALPLLDAEPGNPRFLQMVAGGYNDLGHLYAEGMHDLHAALVCQRKAFGMIERMAVIDPNNRQLDRSTAVICDALGEIETALGNPQHAVLYIERSLAAYDRMPDQTNIAVLYGRAYSQYQMALACLKLGRRNEARRWLECSTPVLEDLRARGITQDREATMASKARQALTSLQ